MKGYRSVCSVKKHSQRPDKTFRKRDRGIWGENNTSSNRVSELLSKKKIKTK